MSWLYYLSEIALRRLLYRVLQFPIDWPSGGGGSKNLTYSLEAIWQITTEFIEQVENW
jgi:hypothetical protein